MKTRSFVLSVAIVIVTFAFSSAVFAQNKETKPIDNKVKTEVKKVETKKEDVKQTAGTIQEKTNQNKETVKTEVKKNTETTMNKTEKDLKHHKMHVKKNNEVKTEKEKK